MKRKQYKKIIEWDFIRGNDDKPMKDNKYLWNKILYMIPIIGWIYWLFMWTEAFKHRKVYWREIQSLKLKMKQDTIKINIEIEEWVGVGIVYRINKGVWMSEEEFFKELKNQKLNLNRTLRTSSNNQIKEQMELSQIFTLENMTIAIIVGGIIYWLINSWQSKLTKNNL